MGDRPLGSDDNYADIWGYTDFLSSLDIPILQDVEPTVDLNINELTDDILTRLQQTEQQTLSEVPVVQPAPDVQCLESNFAGPYNFGVSFAKLDYTKEPKKSAWIFSDSLDELFVKMNVDCPVTIWLKYPVPPSAFIRLTPVYRREVDKDKVPERCLVHSESTDETNSDHHATDHILRSYMPGAEHVVDPETGRMSLLLPCQFTQSFPMKYILRFMCRTSCVGGMNRRPFSVIFTLEINGTCLGRHITKVHVCLSPRRECRNEESREASKRADLALEEARQRSTELPLAQDVKRVCRRYTAAVSENKEQEPKAYKFLDMEPLRDLNLSEEEKNFLANNFAPVEGKIDEVAAVRPEHAVFHSDSNFAGPYEFTVNFPDQDDYRGPKKSAWIYSESLDELFVEMNVDCPVEVCLEYPVPPSAFIRLTPVYRRALDQDKIPTRCLVHLDPKDKSNRDHHATDHLLRSYMPRSEHVLDSETGRRSLLLPCQFIHKVSPLSYVVRFMCCTSCNGGMNRRPFSVVFTLEINGKCLGRQIKKVHVCAAPRRDCKNKEAHQHSKRPADVPLTSKEARAKDSQVPLAQDVKRVCTRYTALSENKQHESNPRKVYKLQVSSLRTYEILKALQTILEANLRARDVRTSTEDES